jgi:hypothetical protein
MQLALFRPCRQMAIGVIYSILDQGPNFGAEDCLHSFKLGVGISDSSGRMCSLGFFLATALMSLAQCQIKLMFKCIGHRSHLHGRSTGRVLNNFAGRLATHVTDQESFCTLFSDHAIDLHQWLLSHLWSASIQAGLIFNLSINGQLGKPIM